MSVAQRASALSQESLYPPKDWVEVLNILGDQADLLLPVVKYIVAMGQPPAVAASIVWRVYSHEG